MKLISLAFLFNFMVYHSSSVNGRIEHISPNVEFTVPDKFARLSQAETDHDYPIVSQRPDIVFKNGDVKFALNLKSSPAQERDLPAVELYFEKLYKGMSAVNFISSERRTIDTKPFVILKFEIRSKGQGDRIFNYFFFTSVDGKLLLGDYSFPFKNLNEEQSEADHVISSFKTKHN